MMAFILTHTSVGMAERALLCKSRSNLGVFMSHFSREVGNFIRDCEVLQALLAKDNSLTDEELRVITFLAKDLLNGMNLAKQARDYPKKKTES
jgi:hypothetical protein